MRVRVLGSAAGGGFPQWNCACPNCRAVRAGAEGYTARTQASLAVSGDGQNWYLLNISPDIRAQLEAAPELQPASSRASPIAGAIFINGDLDACLGALCLRESTPLNFYTTETIQRGLTSKNQFFRTLQRFEGHVTWRALKLNERIALALPRGGESGLDVEAISVGGKVPVHLVGIETDDPRQNIGLLVRARGTDQALGFFPSVAGPSPELEGAIARTQCCFFDGTFWAEDELPALGLGERTAREMAHWPLSGEAGSLAWLRRSMPGRRLLIHINNTNPILYDKSPERQQVLAAGVEVAHDGMELRL
jgi:pyrroloquinoline quinone biosynthesis protein B